MSWRTAHVFVLITGFVIGAGILGLPIKIGLSGAGFIPGSAMILLSAAFQVITALYIVEALINVRAPRELTGVTHDVLGRWASAIVYVGILVYLVGALTAYVTFGGIAIESLSHGIVPYFLGAILYWVAGSYIVWRGVKAVGSSELVLVSSFMALLALNVLILACSPYFKFENLLWGSWPRALDVYGIALFAYAAHFAIASAYKEYKGGVRSFCLGVSLGFLVPALAYVFWTMGFMGVIDREEYFSTFVGRLSGLVRHGLVGLPAPIAVAELGKFGFMYVMGYVFGFLTTITSFIAGAFTLSRVNEELGGYKLGRAVNFWALTVLPPLILALARLAAFEEILSMAGSLGASLFGGIVPALLGLSLRLKKMKTIVPGGCPLVLATLAFYLTGLAYSLLGHFG